MQVFISWSGERSRRVAEFLAAWIKVVVQASNPWVSTELDRGSNWTGEISSALSSTNVGVLCVTAANKTAPWLLFEAGALAKGLTKSRVIPLLIDLEPTDLGMPLSQFNATSCTREGITQLVHTVNRATSDPLPQDIVETSIAAHWARFEQAVSSILNSTESPEPVVPRSDGDKLDELLTLLHGVSGRVLELERTVPEAYARSILGSMSKIPLTSSQDFQAAIRKNYKLAKIGDLGEWIHFSDTRSGWKDIYLDENTDVDATEQPIDPES